MAEQAETEAGTDGQRPRTGADTSRGLVAGLPLGRHIGEFGAHRTGGAAMKDHPFLRAISGKYARP